MNTTVQTESAGIVSVPDLPDGLIAEAYEAAARRNVLAAMNPKVFFGYFSVCADGKGHGGNTTFPGLDWGQSAEALLWLGRKPEILASWEYVKRFQREDGLVPFAILPDMAGKTTLVNGRYPLKGAANGAIFEHWVPGNPLRTLANVTFLKTADAIFEQTVDREWLKAQTPWLRGAAAWLLAQITPEGLMRGGAFYLELPTRLEFDGVNQSYSAHALSRATLLLEAVGEAEIAGRCRAAAATLTNTFQEEFWAGDHCVEYIHPERGAISRHGLTDVDWAAVATGVASKKQTAMLWPKLKENMDFVYSGIPGGIATKPETYEDWEVQNISRHDLAAMGRCWYLECWARARMGDAEGLIRSLRQVATVGKANNWSWMERYYSKKTGDLGSYHFQYYCEYPANLIRIVQRFLLGVDLRLDGSVVLAPTVTEDFWEKGFGQTLAWRDRTLQYRMERNRIAGTYVGGASQRLGVRLPGGEKTTTFRAVIDGKAASVGREGELVMITLPAAAAPQTRRFEITRGRWRSQ